MNCLITGINYNNIGSVLMLNALIENIDQKMNLIISPATPKIHFKTEKLKLLKEPLPLFGNAKFKIYMNFPLLVRFIKEIKKGEYSMSDIDIIIDISGFAFGDQWGAFPAHNLNILIKKASKLKKLILLPQAFGPFNSFELKMEMKKIIESASMIYARDEQSFSFLKFIAPSSKNIKCFPDTTLTYNIQFDHEDKNYISIIPNMRMLDKGGEWKNLYKVVLSKCIDYVLTQTSLNVKLIIHDSGNEDILIATELQNKASNKRVQIIEYVDHRMTKKIIANSKLVISSRFHALASALSTNVPSISLSWSHKYYELMKDYNIERFNHSLPNEDKIIKQLGELLEKELYQNVKKQLLTSNTKIKSASKIMWEEVNSLISL